MIVLKANSQSRVALGAGAEYDCSQSRVGGDVRVGVGAGAE